MDLIPNADINLYLGLPEGVRTEVNLWHRALLDISRPGVGKSLAAIAAQFGTSPETARRKYDALHHHGWRGLINRSRLPQRTPTRTEEFLEWWRDLYSMYQRNAKAAYREFCRRYLAREHIPGLSPDLNRGSIPTGYGYHNLMRFKPTRFEVAAMRRGLACAISEHGPKIFTTRADLWYGSHYMIDDLWHDNFVVFGKQIVRVLELDLLDVFSGALVNFGCKPRFQREDGTFDNLKEKYARLLVAKVLWSEGYSPRGTEIVAEHGTAAVNERVAAILHNATGGLVTVRRSGIVGQEQAIIGWSGEGRGNFRFKAPLESLRNLKHNELANQTQIHAQTGKDVEHRPEHTHGQLRECSEWLKIITVLAQDNPARAAQIQLNLLDYHAHFLPILITVYDAINRRTWHTLEGWHAAGNIVTGYRTAPALGTSDPSDQVNHSELTDQQFRALPAPAQEVLKLAAQSDPRYLYTRKLSPHQVRARDRGSLTTLPSPIIAELLGPDFARELKVDGAYFAPFQDAEIAPEPLLYESAITAPDGTRQQLPEDTFQVTVNPFDPSAIFVSDARGICLGAAPRAARVDRSDDEALKRAFGHRNQRLAEMKRPLLKRHAELVREQNRRLDNNLAVLAAARDPDEALAASIDAD
jgi:hypothetical protein